MDTKVLTLTYPETGTTDLLSTTRRAASFLVILVLFAMTLIPLFESAGRRVAGFGIPGATSWVQHLTLWLGLLGAIWATFQKRHLAIAANQFITNSKIRHGIELLTGIGTTAILLCLAWASWILVESQQGSPETIGGLLPVWLAQLTLPVAFLVMAAGTVVRVSSSWPTRFLIMGFALLAGPSLTLIPGTSRALLTHPGLSVIIVLALMGMPLFAVLGGLSLLLFYTAGIPIAAVPAEVYRLVTQPVLPSIPLFALAGTVLAAGGAPKRLVRLVQAWTSWLPGGPSVSTVLACAIFTALTGASGVTILALGGLLLPILTAVNHKEKFGIGLLTASGSVGLLFPPSLPVILYGVYGRVPIDRLFLAALLPGFLLILMLAGFSMYVGRDRAFERPPFDFKEAVAATWAAKGYLLLPVTIILGLFMGIMTLVETAALTALWAILLETVFHRELQIRTELPVAMRESAVIVGALLIVMGLSLGLVSYMVDAEIPQRLTEWAQSAISSRLLFLLILNGLLLLVGALMDIFSAIVVMVPLIIPVGMAFGLDPVHMGIIFLANLELGYLTPPVGMNLFLSSLRFNRTLLQIWKTVLPFLLIFAVWVLLITYLPYLTLGIGDLFGW